VNEVSCDLALISGASKGIGFRTAKTFAKAGLTVHAIGRNLKDLNRLKNEINRQGGHCYFQSIDLTIESQIGQIISRISSTGAKIRVLIHNAGIAKVGRIDTMDPADWRKTIEVNLTAPFLLTHKLLPFMADNGHIFFINSVAGRQTFPEWSAYCASKWGLKALADSLRQELIETNIKVTSVYPGSVDTTMHDQLPYNWDRKKMLKDIDIANVIFTCFDQAEKVQIKELDLENLSGTF
jgi:NADP-dependent 3-hydroxy acid dehydrogenase YdfG